MNLADVFTSVAYKELVQVDMPGGSNQHEVNVNKAMKSFFGDDSRITSEIQWFYFSDKQETRKEKNTVTFYDARAKSNHLTGRSEYRLYYVGDFLTNARIGDTLILARTNQDKIYGMVFPKDSGLLRAVRILFPTKEITTNYQIIPVKSLSNQELELSQRLILEELGIEFVLTLSERDISLVAKEFGDTFPTTKRMSEFARQQISALSDDADLNLISMISREEELFLALEKIGVQKKIDKGFDSVDDFIRYSLSVQNRRKSRMGHALQNHLEFIFIEKGLHFTAQCVTERKNKPDFIFPGFSEYHDEEFNASLLTMLGVKSTAKDRWRQVLSEASRVPAKHLFTLEQGISEDQTTEMFEQKVTPVIPRKFHASYSEKQCQHILTLDEFIKLVHRKQ